MEEASHQKHKGFAVLRADIAAMMHALTAALPELCEAIAGPQKSAAE
jgi:hypothetical protein